MILREKLYTAAEFWVIEQLPENADKRLELIDGVIVEMASSSQKNTVVAGRVIYFLNAFVIPRDLGYVSGADGGYTVDVKNAYQPDAGYISKVRHPQLEGIAFPIAPDIAVEVISPSESSKNVMKKVLRYIQGGSRLVWTMYADDETVYVWQLGDDGEMRWRVLSGDDVLDGGDVLPGFSIKVSEIFPK
jgi:Uma2 family endonuclease